MEYESEDELKQRMGIDSWRNLSKDKFIAFVSDLPNMSDEVAKQVIAQFPEFKTLVLGSLDQVQIQAANAVGVNWKSQKKVHRAFTEYREVLTHELDREGLTAEDRFKILEMLREAIADEAAKDSDHKAFVLKAVGIVATAGAVVVGAGIAALGGKSAIGGK